MNLLNLLKIAGVGLMLFMGYEAVVSLTKRLSPLSLFADPAALPAPPVPVTLVHGIDDDTVPLRMSQVFTAGRLIEIPGAGHFDLIDPQSRAWPRVLSVLAGTRA